MVAFVIPIVNHFVLLAKRWAPGGCVRAIVRTSGARPLMLAVPLHPTSRPTAPARAGHGARRVPLPCIALHPAGPRRHPGCGLWRRGIHAVLVSRDNDTLPRVAPRLSASTTNRHRLQYASTAVWSSPPAVRGLAGSHTRPHTLRRPQLHRCVKSAAEVGDHSARPSQDRRRVSRHARAGRRHAGHARPRLLDRVSGLHRMWRAGALKHRLRGVLDLKWHRVP